MQLFFPFSRRLQNENRFHIPGSQCIPEGSPKMTLQMKDKNLPLREDINVDEIELHTNEEWKLPHKNLRYRKYSIILILKFPFR